MSKFLIKSSDAIITSEHGVSTFSEYSLPFPSFSFGVSEVNGRYPSSGFDVDDLIDAAWYVESGNGQISVGGEEFSVTRGDVVVVPKGKRFCIRGDGLRLAVISSPPWSATQHRHLDA